MALKRIVLHGYLKNLWSEDCWFEVSSVAEAIKAFCLQTKAFDVAPGQPRHHIAAIGYDSEQALFEPTEADEIHLVPQFAGGKSAFLQIALGSVMIAAGIGLSLAGFPMVGAFFISTGIGLTMGGISMLLAPAPPRTTTNNSDGSRYLGSPRNTVAIGTRIPIPYGRNKIYGHFLSFNITAKEVGN